MSFKDLQGIIPYHSVARPNALQQCSSAQSLPENLVDRDESNLSHSVHSDRLGSVELGRERGHVCLR